jgi:hypothetical protein
MDDAGDSNVSNVGPLFHHLKKDQLGEKDALFSEDAHQAELWYLYLLSMIEQDFHKMQ